MTAPRNTIGPLNDALNMRALALAQTLLPAGQMEGGEWASSSKNHGDIGAVSVVVKGSKAGRVGFWQGRPDKPGTNGGDLLHLIMAVNRLDLKGAIEWARSWLGGAAPPVDATRAVKEDVSAREREQKRRDWMRGRARELFEAARPLGGSLAERYMEARGTPLAMLHGLSDRVRFHPSVEWWRGATTDGRRRVPGPRFPCIVSAIDDADGNQLAGHFTFLARDGRGKAPVEKAKLMMGEVQDGLIYLRRSSKPGHRKVVNEGLENGWTAMMAQNRDDAAEVAPSLHSLKHVRGGEGCTGIILCPHNDWNNPAALRDFERAQAAIRRHGLPVAVLRPPPQVNDLNDLVKSRG
jgi:hypothetical protein